MPSLFGSSETLSGWSLYLTAPAKTLVATSFSDVRNLIQEAETEALNGSHVAVMLSYEASPAFDSSLKTHILDSHPLAWAAVYPSSDQIPTQSGDYQVSEWTPTISRADYTQSVARIRELISAGDTYQVNYSFPLEASFSGNALKWYEDLCLAQRAHYSAYLDLGRYQILSVSPELFFERALNRVVTRPMKGTVRRGRWPAEDQELATWLKNSAKNRAENIMIVDLLRNDLGKVSELASVEVTSFFELERFPTLWQLTSTVEATLRENVSLLDLFTALFPCGSITGAPKIRTMEIIKSLERTPRGPYTGAIGFLKPGGDCIFNVAIRTVVLDTSTNKATFCVGGGVTFDSTPELEYEECLLKADFLNTKPIFSSLFESIRLEDGNYFLLDRHLRRLEASALYFDFVCREEEIRSLLHSIAEENCEGTWKVRLELLPGGKIQIVVSELHELHLRRVALASRPVDTSDRFLFHKTTNRKFYEEELAARPDCDDILFWNPKGEITESTIANIVVKLDGELVTPPVESGLLAGTYRDELLAEGSIRERIVTVEELTTTPEIYLINSVRKWMRASLVLDVAKRSSCSS